VDSHPSGIELVQLEDGETDLADTIEQKIIEERLYFLGRFEISSKKSSLCWVRTDALIGDGSLTSSLVRAFTGWISSRPGKKVLVGIDALGASLAALASVEADIPSISIDASINEGTGTIYDGLDDRIKEMIVDSSRIIMITDVIRTGGTLGRLISFLTNVTNFHGKFDVLSVLMDRQQTLDNELVSKVDLFATCCDRVRFVVIDDDALPSKDILVPSRFLRY
jgi:orotate phosphoribosyltransferase